MTGWIQTASRAPRVGGDAKRQKVRIRDLRKTLQESGWKSVGRAVNVE